MLLGFTMLLGLLEESLGWVRNLNTHNTLDWLEPFLVKARKFCNSYRATGIKLGKIFERIDQD